MNDAILTPVEKYFKEVKDFSKLLLVLSVAMITVIGATYDVKEDPLLDYAFVYFSVIVGQIFSIGFGVLLHRELILLYRAMLTAKEPETFFLQDNPQVTKTVRGIKLHQNSQIIIFLLSMVVFANNFVSWQVKPMVDQNMGALKQLNRKYERLGMDQKLSKLEKLREFEKLEREAEKLGIDTSE